MSITQIVIGSAASLVTAGSFYWLSPTRRKLAKAHAASLAASDWWSHENIAKRASAEVEAFERDLERKHNLKPGAIQAFIDKRTPFLERETRDK